MSIFDLTGKKGLIIGIANDQSIAYGCAKAIVAQGAEVAVTYLNEKTKTYTQPLVDELKCQIFEPCDVREEGHLENVFHKLEQAWGKVDFVLHSIAFAPKEDLHARVVDCTADGFNQAMTISSHSFIKTAKLAEPLMKDGGCLLTVTFYGSERVVDHYNMMGPVKAALESSVRYLAAELGKKDIRVHAISPGAIITRAASGIDRFDELLQRAAEQAPIHHHVHASDVGGLAAFLVSDAASKITGTVIPVDGGQHIMA
ncbi:MULTISPECIES: enoyl-ACP reductase FabI [unclassified Moraxella]|uniref:enoyl-ACP reductase FabI n=1 Tax=unclassified Moraxella TaxID=2685852 RepID=UPI003AF48AA8